MKSINKNSKIAIIGAGASGLTTAYTLKKNGYENITIFEKEEKVGGKVNSFEYKGFYFELGQLWVGANYKTVLELAKEHGITFKEEDLFFDLIDKDGSILNFNSLMWKRFSVFQIMRAVKNYLVLHKKFVALLKNGFHQAESDFLLSFSDFAKKYKIEPLAETFFPFWMGCGYGFYEDVPTIYVIPLFMAAIDQTFSNLFKTFRKKSTHGGLKLHIKGHQTLWAEIGKKLNIKLNTKVIKITRKENEDGKNIIISTEDETLEFDKLIISAPPNEITNFLDLTPTEADLFGRIQYYENHVTIFEAHGLEKTKNTFIIPLENLSPQKTGHTVLLFTRKETPNIYVSYQLTKLNSDQKKVFEILKTDLSDNNITFEKLVIQKKWIYFPHVKTKDLNDSFYTRLNAIQGLSDTYYVGGIMNFEAVEYTSQFAGRLMSEHFPPQI